MASRFDTPGWASGSWRTRPTVSVTARDTVRRITSGGSSSPIRPAPAPVVLPIFAVGSARSMIRAAVSGRTPSGTVNVRPYRELNRIATVRASSRCWLWSSPTGTWSTSCTRMSAAISTGYVSRLSRTAPPAACRSRNWIIRAASPYAVVLSSR
jgi:hypothetical protein